MLFEKNLIFLPVCWNLQLLGGLGEMKFFQHAVFTHQQHPADGAVAITVIFHIPLSFFRRARLNAVEGCLVIRFLADFCNLLGIFYLAVRTYDDDRPGEKTGEHPGAYGLAVIFTELG